MVTKYTSCLFGISKSILHVFIPCCGLVFSSSLIAGQDIPQLSCPQSLKYCSSVRSDLIKEDLGEGDLFAVKKVVGDRMLTYGFRELASKHYILETSEYEAVWINGRCRLSVFRYVFPIDLLETGAVSPVMTSEFIAPSASGLNHCKNRRYPEDYVLDSANGVAYLFVEVYEALSARAAAGKISSGRRIYPFPKGFQERLEISPFMGISWISARSEMDSPYESFAVNYALENGMVMFIYLKKGKIVRSEFSARAE